MSNKPNKIYLFILLLIVFVVSIYISTSFEGKKDNRNTNESFESYGSKARVALAESNVEEALLYANKALALNPDYVDSLEVKAITSNVLKKYDDALLASEQCVKLKPEHFDCWIHKGMAESFLGRCEALEATLNHVSSVNNVSKEDRISAENFLGSSLNSCKKKQPTNLKN